jgi:hypothetical protein
MNLILGDRRHGRNQTGDEEAGGDSVARASAEQHRAAHDI